MQRLPGGYFYVDKPEALGPYVRFSSIRGFKGLEAPVVILCELEDLDEETRDQQLLALALRDMRTRAAYERICRT